MSGLIKLFTILLFVTSIFAHSQLRCAKYDVATDTCSAPIRNQAQSFGEEQHEISGGQAICQINMSNPISAYYANGPSCPEWAPCPDGMGTFAPGERFNIMWYARNHAVDDQNPGQIVLYISPVEAENQNVDFPRTSYREICRAPYKSCNGLNDNEVRCYTACSMPTDVVAGIHTLWWKWDWQSAIYSTCADIIVTGSSRPTGVVTTGVATTGVATTGVATTGVATTGVATTGVATTGVATTGVATTGVATTGAAATGSSSKVCNGENQGIMKCMTSETYSTCNRGSWGASQSCRRGQTCRPTGDYIYCV